MSTVEVTYRGCGHTEQVAYPGPDDAPIAQTWLWVACPDCREPSHPALRDAARAIIRRLTAS